jgi:hypothetical protein
MAEWTRATARHASPYIGLAPASPYVVGHQLTHPIPITLTLTLSP